MPTPSVINKYRYSDSIDRQYWDRKFFFDQFLVNPVSCAVGGGAASGVAGHQNVLFSHSGQYEYNVIGTQVQLAPEFASITNSLANILYGLNMVQTATSGQGSEFCIGQTAGSPAGFVIGQSAAFFLKCQFTVTTAAGINPLLIGFRKAQAFNATLTTYTDYATIGIVGTASPNTIQIQSQIGSAGNVVTNTTQTWADTESHYLEVLVDSSGNVTYQIDGQAPTVIPAVNFQFTAGQTVIPFIRQTQSATTTAQVVWSWFECGYQS